jgi:hypothetical protein
MLGHKIKMLRLPCQGSCSIIRTAGYFPPFCHRAAMHRIETVDMMLTTNANIMIRSTETLYSLGELRKKYIVHFVIL